MADQNQQAERLNFVTVPGIANFPHLFEPDSKNGKYTLTVLFDKKDPAVSQMMRDLQAKCAEAIRRGIDGEPGRDGKSYAPFSGHSMDDKEWVGRLRLPVEDGDTARFDRGDNVGKLKKDVYEEYEGRWVLKTGTKTDLAAAGWVVDSNRRRLTAADLYSGAIVRVNVWLYAYKQDNSGVGAMLNAVVKTGDGERIGEQTDPLAAFGLPDAQDASNPFAGMGV